MGVAQKFMLFSSTQWSIVSNLFRAGSALYRLQASSTEYDAKLQLGHAEIMETISLTVSIFNEIISKIGDYRELSEDAFDFLTDDLQRAVGSSKQIADSITGGYNEPVKETITVLRNKLSEIGDKVKRHLITEKKVS